MAKLCFTQTASAWVYVVFVWKTREAQALFAFPEWQLRCLSAFAEAKIKASKSIKRKLNV